MKIRSEKHLRYVAGLNCLINNAWDETVIPHHLLRAGGKGIGTKACDSLCVPLSHFNHERLHANGNEVVFLINNGWPYLNVLYLVQEINSNSPDKRIREATTVLEAIEFYKKGDIELCQTHS